MSSPLWYKHAVFYQVYLRSFMDGNADGHGDLEGLLQKLDYLKDLGIDCIWLMPIYPSPLNDDGYDIADFRHIDPVYGDMQTFVALVDAVHARGMRLIMDLVMNHTSDQHPWFQAARGDRNSPFRDYYVWSDSPHRYSEARIIFLDIEESNWAWEPTSQQYYWHRFYSSQPDLNYANPRVQEEMLDIARYWLGFGIDGFRADAVPYLYEREGTNCENLPETHTYLKRLRLMVDTEFPGRVLLCEANQLPEDVRAYFGDGDEFHLGFHFPLMPRLYMAIGMAQADQLRDVLMRTPSIPASCQWCTFLRNHDELTLEMVTPEERAWMWNHYAPDPRMRLNLGIRRRLAPLLGNDRRAIELMHSLLLTLPGSPILYYGDEIGMGDSIWLPDRNGVRTPMQWAPGLNAGFSTAAPDRLHAPVILEEPFGPDRVSVDAQKSDKASLWHSLRRLLQVRRAHEVFGSPHLEWVETGNQAIAAYKRGDSAESILAIHNLSPADQSFSTQLEEGPHFDLISGRALTHRRTDLMHLGPYQYLWLASMPAEPRGA